MITIVITTSVAVGRGYNYGLTHIGFYKVAGTDTVYVLSFDTDDGATPDDLAADVEDVLKEVLDLDAQVTVTGFVTANTNTLPGMFRIAGGNINYGKLQGER